MLDVPAGRTDLDEFARLRADSRPREALALWRGPALADLDGEPFAVAAAGRLEEQRLAVLEERIDADLRSAGTVSSSSSSRRSSPSISTGSGSGRS